MNHPIKAHWFDMPRFWAAAADLLKPGGSVALWTGVRKEVGKCYPQQFIMSDMNYKYTKLPGTYAKP